MVLRRLSILAGAGSLPRTLVDQCLAAGRPVQVVAFRNITDAATVAGVEHAWLRLGGGAAILDRLRRFGTEDICLVGKFHRPSLAELAPDWRGIRLLFRIGWRSLGDSALLDALAGELEAEGFRVIAPHEIADTLIADQGLLAGPPPDDQAQADIARAIEVATALGVADAGQGVVVQQGIVLTIEAAEGTDAMLKRAETLCRPGPGGVLVKVPKPQQDARLDLPTIGTRTIENAAAAGLRGVVIAAGGALIADRAALVAAAERLGLFVEARRVDRWPTPR